jgi:hypothetical protein
MVAYLLTGYVVLYRFQIQKLVILCQDILIKIFPIKLEEDAMIRLEFEYLRHLRWKQSIEIVLNVSFAIISLTPSLLVVLNLK